MTQTGSCGRQHKFQHEFRSLNVKLYTEMMFLNKSELNVQSTVLH